MAFSIYTAVILAILKGVSDAADDCSTVFEKFSGVPIRGVGGSLDTEGGGTGVDQVEKAANECESICRKEPTAKGWGLLHFNAKECTCFETVESAKGDPAYQSAKFCDCQLEYHKSIFDSSSFALPAFCQTATGEDVHGRGVLPHGASCNLTCTGNYAGQPGVAECRARDWAKAGSRVVFKPQPRCHLNSTAVLYASIGGGLAAVLILFLLIVCCLRQKQKRNKRREEDDHHVTMRQVRGGGGGNEEGNDIGVDRRKSYKKATGHLSMDEESREVDLMINGQPEGIVYANVDLTDVHKQRQGRNMAEPTTMIGIQDVDPIYLEGNIATGNERNNDYIHVNENRS